MVTTIPVVHHQLLAHQTLLIKLFSSNLIMLATKKAVEQHQPYV